MTMPSAFESRFTLGGEDVLYYSLSQAEAVGFGDFARLPKSLKVL